MKKGSIVPTEQWTPLMFFNISIVRILRRSSNLFGDTVFMSLHTYLSVFIRFYLNMHCNEYYVRMEGATQQFVIEHIC